MVDSLDRSELEGGVQMIKTQLAIAHPWLCDSMGHLNSRYYAAMFDDAMFHYLAFIGWNPTSIKNEKKGWADVKGEIEYKKEVLEGNLLEIHSGTSYLGNKSLTVYSEMRNTLSNDTHAICRTTLAYFDLEERRALPIPDLYRSKASQLLTDV
jgi:acyl-CoA thioester hydrolase